jgi:hypothetical protein
MASVSYASVLALALGGAAVPDSAASVRMSLARLLILKLQDFEDGVKEARSWLISPPSHGGASRTALAAKPRNREAEKALAALK